MAIAPSAVADIIFDKGIVFFHDIVFENVEY